MTMRVRKLLLFLALIAFALPLAGQSTYGTISGTVEDASKALIPGVMVTATNINPAMMTGIASGSFALVNYILLQTPVWGLGTLFNSHRYAEAWWIVAFCPAAGILVWTFLTRATND